MPSALEQQSRAELEKSSIVVGYDPLNYSTSAKEMNAMSSSRYLQHPGDNDHRKRIKEEHRVRHFDLGDANEKPLTYDTSSKLQDPTGEIEKYTAKLNVDARAMLVKTSAIVGYEKAQFTTSTKAATQWNRDDMKKSIAMRDETRKITGPKKCPFVYGDDDVGYVSTAKGTMNFDQKDAKVAVMAADVKDDLRKCHYSFGHDNVDYSTSSHIAPMSSEAYREATKKHPPLNDPRKGSVYFS
ncbi:hypothetical protein H257_05917 [Aphanomyces astaci]|uniref:Uncharacterized protein n=1 Tax=Aphanomyces astaci TaxID=112090 RepID=W4GPX4_APHAT|nr:hypothetical protein H257_05917 [Aphanomyces astaci]ETV81381.1 hypothetical protein H257_05917 [Aphanomyces astaci]RQM24871.1 hypothetical protein B5M09_000073 [Aphanomyces astaci]|eukprot:XP_009829239.1 hypothetical protein H257_05917 [Aphanomyces astaci]